MGSKFVIQRGDNKIEFESNSEDGAPHWTNMKDGSGRMITDFVNSFVSVLIPMFITLVILGIIIYYIFC